MSHASRQSTHDQPRRLMVASLQRAAMPTSLGSSLSAQRRWRNSLSRCAIALADVLRQAPRPTRPASDTRRSAAPLPTRRRTARRRSASLLARLLGLAPDVVGIRRDHAAGLRHYAPFLPASVAVCFVLALVPLPTYLLAISGNLVSWVWAGCRPGPASRRCGPPSGRAPGRASSAHSARGM